MTSTEFFINMKKTPDPSSLEYDAFFQRELEKIKYGITINGVFIHGWLYWHLNHWTIYLDQLDPNHSTDIVRVFTKPDFRDNEWLIADYLKQAEDQKKGLMLFGTRRFAKDLLNTSKLYQEDGEIEIGNCKVGDRIYGADGKLTTIAGVYPQGKQKIFKITLRDGRELFCGLNHNWYVYDKHKQEYVVKTTEKLMKGYSYPRIHNGYKNGKTRKITEERYSIPVNSPVQYDKKDLPIDPYFLGLWLGDGSKNKIAITSIDTPIIDYIYKVAKEYDLLVYTDSETYIITSGKVGGNKFYIKNPLLQAFRDSYLLFNKHIPKNYLHSSFDQRLALLQGLLDTDGTSTKGGSISFSNKDERLIDDVYSLCRSLGINTKKKKVKSGYTKQGERIDTGYSFLLSLYTDLTVFRLKRKQDRITSISKGRKAKINKTAITNIEYVFDAESTCIMVDNDSHLFLTDNYTVTHNSDFEASWIGRGATIYQGSENVISSTNEADIKVLASKLDKGLAALHPYLRLGRLQDDWRKEVSLGVKERKSGGRRIEWSKIWIRNLDEGKNTEAIAGTTPKTLVIDEVGKAPFMEAFEAAKPGFTSPFGWRCVPILTGTGGMFIPNSDAEKVFRNPEAHNFLAVDIPGKAKKYGVFLPGTYRMEAKTEVKFGDFIARQSGIVIPVGSELNSIPFFESDVEKAKTLIKEEIDQLAKANDPKAYLKARMYYPEDPDDCFLTADVNEFPVEAIREHLTALDIIEGKQGFVGQSAELYRDASNKVCFKYTTKLKEIKDFPVTAATMKDAPVIIYEPPSDVTSPFLYIAGGDPYNQNTSPTSPSLGTMTIYKRLYDPVNGTFQNMIVATYAARPQLMKDWHRNAEMLLELYGAICMIENAGTNFIDYMDGKNKGHMLADGYNLLHEISPNTGIKNRPKGLPATPRVINHCMRLLYDYCIEEIIGIDETNRQVMKLGVTRIKDRMLLTEMLNYSADGNFDRIVAFRHALAYDSHLQKISPIVRIREDEGLTPPPPPSPRSPFIKSQSPFSITKKTF